MNRIHIERIETSYDSGRKEESALPFYCCYCDINLLNSRSGTQSLHTETSSSIVFEVRDCKKIRQLKKETYEKTANFDVEFEGIKYRIVDFDYKISNRSRILLSAEVVT